MLTSSKPSSDPGYPDAREGRLIVLEGMPGGGKTTAARALAGLGHAVVGEYTDAAHATIDIAAHPGIDDDDAHQANWTRKAALCVPLLDRNPVVYSDRDWLSSLSYAYSVAPGDGGALLTSRAEWVLRCLEDETLLLPGLYVVFDLDPATSASRREGRLRARHPWNHADTLTRLRDFYQDPAGALRPFSDELAGAVTLSSRTAVSGHDDPLAVLGYLVSLSSPAREAR